LTFSFLAKKKYSPLVPQGYELAWDQFILQPMEYLTVADKTEPPMKVKQTAELLIVEGKDFLLSFDKNKGYMVSFTLNGKELLKRGFVPDFWRALIDNDLKSYKKFTDNKWQEAGPQWKIIKSGFEKIKPGVIRFFYNASLPTVKAVLQLTYTVYGSGAVEVAYNYDTAGKVKAPIRFGLQMLLPSSIDQITYYGRGPDPTYQDRMFERLGIFKTTVEDMWVDYSRPQENGNREQTRWLAVTDKNGTGLLFSGEPFFNFIVQIVEPFVNFIVQIVEPFVK
jgi:beta-galactosidase